MLYQLMYSSVATAPMGESDLLALLADARSGNARRGVTGALLYFDRTREFLQVLEGEEPVVKDLMRHIGHDRRHAGVVVAFEGMLEARCFSDWSMGFRAFDDRGLDQFPGYTRMVQDGVSAHSGAGRLSATAALLDLMRATIEQV